MNLFRNKPVFDQYGMVAPGLISYVNEPATIYKTGKADFETNETNFETNFETNETNLETNETNLETNETNLETDKTNKARQDFQLSREEECLLKVIRQDSAITQKRLHESTGISMATIKRALPKLQRIGKLERIGNRRSGKWKVKD